MTVGHNGINVVRNGRAEWEPNPCALPHYDYPESTCTETAGHTGPHAAPLIISGRECGAVAWDESKDPMTVRHTVDSITSDALDALYEQLDAAEAGEAQRQLATAREALASATTRAARAEAAIARVRAVAGWAIQGWSDLSPEKVLLAVEGHQPAPAPAATQATEPREHCGHLSPDIGLTTVRTECVLRPGHSGSHADDVGCRWHPITEQEQLMPTDQPTCTATIEGPHVLGGGPITCTREAGHPANHVGSLQGDDGKTMWTDWTAGATPHRPA